MNATSRPQMAQPGQTVAAAKPIDLIRRGLDQMGNEFAVALPQHIPVDRFKRTVLTAVNQNADLLGADRKSLFGACMKAAQDGLFPDGREGALVIFNTKVKVDGKESWIKAVQWMPMVYGIIKKMRNSGQLASIVAHEVYERDLFKYRLGDEESIEHEPYLGGESPGKMIAVYAIARLKDGTIQREVMTRAQVDRVRNVSKSKDTGPWAAWYEEMARKTVTRRLSKYLPMSTEIEDMLRRDDAISASADVMKLNDPDGHVGPTIEGDPGDVRHIADDDDAAEAARDAEENGTSSAAAEPAHDPETGEIPTATKATDQKPAREELFK